jgi:hypothetical protein
MNATAKVDNGSHKELRRIFEATCFCVYRSIAFCETIVGLSLVSLRLVVMLYYPGHLTRATAKSGQQRNTLR